MPVEVMGVRDTFLFQPAQSRKRIEKKKKALLFICHFALLIYVERDIMYTLLDCNTNTRW